MKAMILPEIVSLNETEEPLRLVDLPKPVPGPDELRIRIITCGVCHTELDEIEGRMPPPRLPVVLGHEVVGRVDCAGREVSIHKEHDRVGVGWIHSSSGDELENLSSRFRATGRDVNGGYAEYMTVPAAYAYPIPSNFSDEQAAPLLCAGAIGYRALKLSGIRDGELLGLTGFGGSAHLVLQLVRHMYPQMAVHVFARDAEARQFALDLGAAWAGDTTDRAPTKLHAIIDTTPVWKPVVEAMNNLRPAGRLVINAIRKEDIDKEYLLNLSYHEQLWMEREIKTVANITRSDIAEYLPLAADIPIVPAVQTFRLEDANQALVELKRSVVKGAKVLRIGK